MAPISSIDSDDSSLAALKHQNSQDSLIINHSRESFLLK
jgi:hypothetical protein